MEIKNKKDLDVGHHIFSKSRHSLSALKKMVKKALINCNLSSEIVIFTHERIDEMKCGISSKTKLIIMDTYGLNSFEVNEIFINTKLRYKPSIVLICDNTLNENRFMHDSIIYKDLGKQDIQERITSILNDIYN